MNTLQWGKRHIISWTDKYQTPRPKFKVTLNSDQKNECPE